MRRILAFLIALFGLFGAIQAFAQTPVPLPFQGNLGSISGSGVPYAGIDIQLQNCPSPVSITGYFGIIQQEYQVQADPSGIINTTVWPNDLITCNGTTGNSQYNLSLVLNGVVQGTPQCYQVVSTQGNWNLNTQQPIPCSQPAPNPQDKTFNNLTVNGFFQGHNGDFSGTLDFGSALVPGKVCNVQFYGAIGNGIANDHDAFQAAVDACYVNGGSVYLPTRWGATVQTVYYTATPINPKGVSMFGPPGASGPGNYYTTALSVAVRGAPSKDVFAIVDAADAGYVQPRNTFAMRDFAVIVDDSIDASGSFPYRKPGRICKDVAATGTAVITSAAQCLFQPGDVGQAITVGSTTTTVSSWQSATQVTLATTITTGTGLSAYISVMGLPVTATIGNCGFAYPDRAGTNSEFNITYKSDFTNFSVQTTTSTGNNSCGFFFQGNQAPTWTRWTNVTVTAGWGFAYVPQNQATPTTSQWAGSTDFNTWQNIFVGARYPFLVYSAGLGTISAMQIAGADAGPQFLATYGVENYPGSWKIDIPELEPDSSCPSANTALRITGNQYVIDRLALSMCSAHPGTIQWDASSSSAVSLFGGNIAAINITGNLNHLTIPYSAGNLLQGATISVTGGGNTLKTGTSVNPLGGTQPGREQYVGDLGGSAFGSPLLSHGGTAFNRDSSFIDKGAAAYYFNAQDLWMWPNELVGYFGALTIASDTGSETGQSIIVSSAQTVYVSGSNGTQFYVGSQVPAGKMRVYFKLKAASGTSFPVGAKANVSTSLGCTGSPFSVTTSYAVYSCDVDTTAYSGNSMLISLGGGSTTANVSVAWIGIRPWDTNTISTGLTLSGGTAMTTQSSANSQIVTCAPGGTGTQVCDAAGTWINSGTPATPLTCSGGNCYRIDGDGTITEWGASTGATGGGTAETLTVSFPHNFTSTTNLHPTAIAIGNPTGDGNPHPEECHIVRSTLATSGFSVILTIPIQVTGSGYSAIGAGDYCSYNALGN